MVNIHDVAGTVLHIKDKMKQALEKREAVPSLRMCRCPVQRVKPEEYSDLVVVSLKDVMVAHL